MIINNIFIKLISETNLENKTIKDYFSINKII